MRSFGDFQIHLEQERSTCDRGKVVWMWVGMMVVRMVMFIGHDKGHGDGK